MANESLKEQLMRHEGFRQFPYECPSGRLTIGYGHNLEANGISKEIAILIFADDIQKAEADVLAFLPWAEKLDTPRYNVLINMCFQMGIAGLLKFINTLQLIKDGKYKEASEAMLKSLWAKQTPNRARELAEIMEFGSGKEK